MRAIVVQRVDAPGCFHDEHVNRRVRKAYDDPATTIEIRHRADIQPFAVRNRAWALRAPSVPHRKQRHVHSGLSIN
jgi:hypothetical protein